MPRTRGSAPGSLFDREGERRAVVRREQEIAHLDRVVAGEDRLEGGEVLGRVGHFFATAQDDQARVRPVPRKRHLAGQRLALGDLVFVVREDQVGAAAVDVDLVAERLADHGRALDVPAGAAATPRARPRRLAFAGVLPQREVARVAFAGLELFARGDELAVQVAVAQFAVVGKRRDVEVHVAAARRRSAWSVSTRPAMNSTMRSM